MIRTYNIAGSRWNYFYTIIMPYRVWRKSWPHNAKTLMAMASSSSHCLTMGGGISAAPCISACGRLQTHMTFPFLRMLVIEVLGPHVVKLLGDTYFLFVYFFFFFEIPCVDCQPSLKSFYLTIKWEHVTAGTTIASF